MGVLSDYDERVKLGVYILVLFLFQGITLYFLNTKMLSEINNKYINQNISIVGRIADYDTKLSNDIIPIITGKENGDYDKGKWILEKYSYDNNLDYNSNPLLEKVNLKANISIVVLSIIFLILVIGGSLFLIHPIFKETHMLAVRAEAIVDGSFPEEIKGYSYKGSLERFISKFNLMEDRIKYSIQQLQDEKINLKNIINDISHQLKTPLYALTMSNDILMGHREMDNEEIDNFINLSREQLDRMDWLVKTLLKYARLESNVVEYYKENRSLSNTIEESINDLRIKAQEKKQQLIFNRHKEIYYYHDRKWIAEAISNIIKNAIEHTGNNGKIEVDVSETPISITIAINDNGEGIEKNEQKKIFKRFHKGENSINPTSIGIGLSLSKAIVQAHNGDITVESELGVGSTFYIIFLKTV